MDRFCAPCLFAVVVTIFSAAIAFAADDLSGSYVGENIKLELKPQSAGTYVGEIEFQQRRFPVTARSTTSGIAGSFISDGNSFDFDATLAGEKLTLRSGGAEYELRKPVTAGNPLAKPAAPNPLAGADTAKPQAPGAKDPLAYKIQQLPGGSIATFDGWKTQEVMNQNNTYVFDTAPQGREKEFVLRVAITTPHAQDLANFLTAAPQFCRGLIQQVAPTFQQVGQSKKTKCGGDDAIAEEYSFDLNGTKLTARALYVKRSDVGIVVLGVGTDQGFKEFSRSIEIVAQSITFKESAIEQELVGSWGYEASSRTDAGGGVLNVSSSRTITILPNSTFTDSASTTAVGDAGTGLAQGGNRGKLLKRGNTLTFHYDNGSTWTAQYSVGGGGLKLDGKLFIKQ